MGVVALGYQDPTTQTIRQSVGSSQSPTVNNVTEKDTEKPSVDEIVSTDVAASIAERANLPIARTIANRAISLGIKSELAQSDDSVVSKPQIVEVSKGQRSIKSYKVKKGDSVQDVSEKFDVSTTTIKWANELDSDALRVGSTIKVPPVDGVVYTVKESDSVEDIARELKTSTARIISYNDLEFSVPKEGQQLMVPNGVLPKSDRPGYVAPAPVYGTGTPVQNGGDYSVLDRNVLATAGNKYAAGNCTWYAYERRKELGRPIGSFWGDGGSWAYSAIAAGYEVNGTPRAGAILVMVGYPGHVAIVETVNSNGDIEITEMNYAGQTGIKTGRTISSGQAKGYQYVHDKK